MRNIVTLMNRIRMQTEGKPMEAYNAAKEAELPEFVREYIALSVIWHACTEAFWALCERISTDESLPLFWRAAALESLGATRGSPEQVAERLDYFDRAVALVANLEPDNEVRLYIETCVAAGRNETVGQTRSLDTFSYVATVMVTQQWFDAPGRLKAYLDELVKTGQNPAMARDLVLQFASMEQEGQHSFSPSQTVYLKNAHADLFPTA